MSSRLHILQAACLTFVALAFSQSTASAQFMWGNPYQRAQMQTMQNNLYMQQFAAQQAAQVYGTNYGIPIYASTVANYYGSGYNPYLYGGYGAGGYGAYNPYVAGAAVNSFANPYTAGGYGTGYGAGGYGGAGNPYLPGGYNGYGGYNPYYNPYMSPGFGAGQYLMGSANVMQSYGNVIQSQESARILREQALQARLKTKKEAFELDMYIKANTPTYTQEQERVAKVTLRRIQTNSLPGEVTNGKSLNFLLDDLRRFPNKKISLEPITLSDGVLSKLSVTKNTYGLGILRDDGRVNWPTALQERMTVGQRKQLDEQLKELVKSAYREKLDVNLLKDVRNEVDKLREDLVKRVNDTPTSQYIDAKRFLQEFHEATVALEKGEAPIQAKFQREIEGGRSVQELVDYMVKNGLRFGPATAADEPAYRAVHSALATFDIAMNAAVGDGKE
jgi:hypothetical protein